MKDILVLLIENSNNNNNLDSYQESKLELVILLSY